MFKSHDLNVIATKLIILIMIYAEQLTFFSVKTNKMSSGNIKGVLCSVHSSNM